MEAWYVAVTWMLVVGAAAVLIWRIVYQASRVRAPDEPKTSPDDVLSALATGGVSLLSNDPALALGADRVTRGESMADRVIDALATGGVSVVVDERGRYVERETSA